MTDHVPLLIFFTGVPVLLNIRAIRSGGIIDRERPATVPRRDAVHAIADATATRNGTEVAGQCRPAAGEGHAQDIQLGVAIVVQVIVVGGDVIAAVLLQYPNVAGAFIFAALIADYGALAGVGTKHAGGAGDGDVITAVRTLAAAAAIHKQIVVIPVARDVRRFDALMIAAVDMIYAAQQLTVALVDLCHTKATKKRTVRHVHSPIVIPEQRRIDRVDLAGTTVGLHYHPEILPAGVLQRRGAHYTDSGCGGTESRNGVVQIVVTIHLDDIRRPEMTGKAGHRIVNPGGPAVAKHRVRCSSPVHEVGRGGVPDALTGGEMKIGIAILNDSRGIMRILQASQLQRRNCTAGQQTKNRQGAQEPGSRCVTRSGHSFTFVSVIIDNIVL